LNKVACRMYYSITECTTVHISSATYVNTGANKSHGKKVSGSVRKLRGRRILDTSHLSITSQFELDYFASHLPITCSRLSLLRFLL